MVGTHSAAWFTALFTIGMALLLAASLPGVAGIEERGGGLVAHLSNTIEEATRPLADIVQRAGQLEGLSEESALLRQQVVHLEAQLAALRESQIETKQLADLIAAVGAKDTDRYLPAAVILRDPAPARDVIIIDLGERNGLRAGQPVLGPGATFVGVVSEVQRSRARVRLLTDPDSAIAAVIQASRTQAALVGGPDGLRLEFVPSSATITVDDLVLTSALGGRLPGGLLVGRITFVEMNNQHLFSTVHVEPLADYGRLERVLVLTGSNAAAGARP